MKVFFLSAVPWWLCLLSIIIISISAPPTLAALPLRQRIGNGKELGLDSAISSPPQELSTLSCRRLLGSYQGTASGNALQKDLPETLRNAFTLDGRVSLERYIVDDTHNGKGSHYKYTRADMEKAATKARAQLAAVREAAGVLGLSHEPPLLQQGRGEEEAGGPLVYGATVSALAAAAEEAKVLSSLRVQDRYYVAALAALVAVEGKHALVFGSIEVGRRGEMRRGMVWGASKDGEHWVTGRKGPTTVLEHQRLRSDNNKRLRLLHGLPSAL
jgi:hypothetical protein